jgi:hypothetical protein
LLQEVLLTKDFNLRSIKLCLKPVDAFVSVRQLLAWPALVGLVVVFAEGGHLFCSGSVLNSSKIPRTPMRAMRIAARASLPDSVKLATAVAMMESVR